MLSAILSIVMDMLTRYDHPYVEFMRVMKGIRVTQFNHGDIFL
jgi:hypothetical protein